MTGCRIDDAGSGRPLHVDLHLGIDGRTQGGADDPGPRRPLRRPGAVLVRRRPLLRDAAVPRQRAQRGRLPGVGRAGRRIALRRKFSASGFLPDIREYGARSSTPSAGRSPTSWPPTRPSRRPRPLAQVRARRPRPSEPDKVAFTRRFGVPLFEGYGSSENAIILLPRPDIRRGARAGPATATTSRSSSPETASSAHGPEFDDRRPAAERGRGHRRDRRPQHRRRDSRATTTTPRPRPSGSATAGTGRATWPTATTTASSTSPAGPGDWLRVDQENFAAAPVERILNRWPAAAGRRRVRRARQPDGRPGDGRASSWSTAATFDPDDFAAFLAEQPDLGTKWAPRYVRIVDALPVTGTDKVDKTAAAAQPVGHDGPDLAPRRPQRRLRPDDR